jgi:hypothetical protein
MLGVAFVHDDVDEQNKLHQVPSNHHPTAGFESHQSFSLRRRFDTRGASSGMFVIVIERLLRIAAAEARDIVTNITPGY